MEREYFLWVEKYRPKTISDCILPGQLKDIFQKFVDDRNVPNLLLAGRAGIGKTTVARAMLEELDSDYYILNGSIDGNIDTLRTRIKDFASTVSFNGDRKYVILDEADYLTAATQPALRNFIEEYSKNCGFIFTCNFPKKIIEPLHSRCSVIEFKIPAKEKQDIASQFHKRACNILDKEGVEYDKKVVAQLILNHFPDWRKVLNELQKYASQGKIDIGILSASTEKQYEDLIDFLKNKKFESMRSWVGKNRDMIDTVSFYRDMYDFIAPKLKSNSIPNLVLIIADYQYKAAFVADQEINIVACLTQIMVDCEFV